MTPIGVTGGKSATPAGELRGVPVEVLAGDSWQGCPGTYPSQEGKASMLAKRKGGDDADDEDEE